MNSASISSTLNKIFSSGEPQDRIVFWNDDGGESQELLDELALDEVNTVRLDETSALQIKIKLELEDISGKYLIYSTSPPSAPEKDWLIGLRLHSSCLLYTSPSPRD